MDIRLFLIGLSCLFAVLLPRGGAAADPAADGHGLRPADNVLRCGLHVSTMGKLDPHFAAGSQDRAFADMVFNALLRYEPGNAPVFEPDLAVELPTFELVDAGQIWTVRLRRGVMFHAGPLTESYELTADDVVYSIGKSADREHSAYAGDYRGMTAAKVDRYTVRITLPHPLSPTLFFPKITNYSGGFIVSKRACEAMGYEAYARHPVGTGPFFFKEHVPGQKVVLQAHQKYFRGPPKLDGVELHLLPDGSRRAAALLDGRLDVVMSSAASGWIEDMERRKSVVIDQFGVGEACTFYLNTMMPPLDDIRVRRAIAYALDRDRFLATNNRKFVEKAYSPVPAGFLPGGLSGELAATIGLAYGRDLELARSLMKDAGFEDGFSLDLVVSEKRIYRSLYESLKRQLAAIAIECRLHEVSHADMHKIIRSKALPIVLYIAWRPNADVFLTKFFHSASIIIGGADPDTNFSAYGGVDTLIENARLETDPNKQIQLWQQAQIKILDDMAAYPVMTSLQVFARRTYVDYGHPLNSSMALYPQFTERTRLRR